MNLEFPELAGKPERFDSEFRSKLEKIVELEIQCLEYKLIWTKSGAIVMSISTALGPLSVASSAQSVRFVF